MKQVMRRSIEERHAPKRRTEPRRHPRAQVFGFTEHQWPFINVLLGSWLFAAFFLGLGQLFWRWAPTAWTLADRIALVIKDAVIAILPAVLAICIVAAQRLNPSLFVGRVPKPNSSVDINNRFILNTVEQFILYFIGNAGIALYCPPEDARTLIILTALFVVGRVLFWIGYHYDPHLRAFGFGVTFYPTVTVYLWLILYMVFGIQVQL
jgi:MAPEG family